MKLKHIKIVACATFVALFSAGCDDYLETVNPNEIQEVDYYSNLSETQSAVTAVYYSALDQYIWNCHFEGSRSDMGWPGYGRPTPSSSSNTIWYYHTYTSSTGEIDNMWSGIYEGIYRANQAIQGLNSLYDTGAIVEADDVMNWNEQMGQALFFRGYFHHLLSVAFKHTNGKCAIIRDATPTTQEEYYKDLSTREEVIDFARTDLKAAYELLPAQWDGVNSIATDVGRVTAATAATVLGVSYLYDSDFVTAGTYFKDVIENTAYGLSLETNFDNISTYAGEFNSESILEIGYSDAHKTEEGTWSAYSVASRFNKFCQGYSQAPTWICNDYSTEPIDEKDSRNYFNMVNSDTGETTYRLRTVPRRCSAYVAVNDDIHTAYYDETCTTNGYGPTSGGYGWGVFRTLTSWDDSSAVSSDWLCGKNLILHNLSEVYINYAECLAEQGSVTEAISYINKIRQRWALQLIGPAIDDAYTYDGLSYDKTALMDHIMYIEKPLEINIKGFMSRWADMRRWGIIESRFAELATRTYYNNTFNLDGTLYTESGEKVDVRSAVSRVRLYQDADALAADETFYSANSTYTVDYEYDTIAATVKELDGNVFGYYYPIPSTELTANQGIQ